MIETEGKYYTDERNVQIVIALLKAHGIRKIVASPGTTNITFVGSVQQDPWFEIYSSVDERSAAYIACGLSAESDEPVVLTCTGATASRNYYSGLTEAYYRKLPIVALTSHQGNYRIGHLIAQNIDRRKTANDIVKISVEAPIIKDSNDEKLCTIEVNKALLELKHHGGGPIHINLFTSYSKNFTVKELPPVRVIRRHTAFDSLPAFPAGKVAVFVGSHKKFTDKETKVLDRFCATHDAVVLCDHTSGYKGDYMVQAALPFAQSFYDSPNRKYDLVVHIGEVSGNYPCYRVNGKTVWRVNEDGELRDLWGRLTDVFEMPESYFFEHYSEDGKNLHACYDGCVAEIEQLQSELPELPFGNIWMARQMSMMLPETSELHLGILNTLRSWNFFDIPKSVDSNSNVGGFGIDGDISSLVGASLANPQRIYIGVFGDLAFFYDMNVLGNRHVGNNVRIMLINNGCGTEFRNYSHPCHAFGENAAPYMSAAGHYGNKSLNLVRHYAEDLGYEYITASGKEDFIDAAKRFLTPHMTDKPMLFEVFTDSQKESDALEITCGFKVDPKKVLKDKVKKVVKDVVGEKGMETIKKVIK